MLKLKPNCEHCGGLLPPNSTEARICSFECTFCSTCVDTVLHNVCPNCGGGFEKRPIRPLEMLKKYPSSDTSYHKPIVDTEFAALLVRYKDIDADKR